METPDVRWRQRFENYQKALQLLISVAELPNPTEAERGGMIHFFEMTFELGWKLLKDLLEENGFSGLMGPRDIIKKAFEAELIADGHAWIDALKKRNLTSHTYEEETVLRVEKEIKARYLPFLLALRNDCSKR